MLIWNNNNTLVQTEFGTACIKVLVNSCVSGENCKMYCEGSFIVLFSHASVWLDVGRLASQSVQNQHLLDGLARDFVQALMVPRRTDFGDCMSFPQVGF